jgi:hypothetical protein
MITVAPTPTNAARAKLPRDNFPPNLGVIDVDRR